MMSDEPTPPLRGAFNCILGAIYNSLTQVHGYRFPLAAIGVDPEYFALHHWDGVLTPAHPETQARTFLARIGAAFDFAPRGGPDEALAYLDDHLAHRGVLPLAINLRYSVLDPSPSDNDFWNFQLAVRRLESGEYQMFDMYHGEHYTADRTRLRQMIDTPFNYRDAGRFTPFMEIAVRAPERTHAALATLDVHRATASAIANYPLAANQASAAEFFATLRARFLPPAPAPAFHLIYRVMGFQMLIVKARANFVTHVREIGWEPADELAALEKRWDTFAHSVAMTMGRCQAGEYDRLTAACAALIADEHAVLQAYLARTATEAAVQPA